MQRFKDKFALTQAGQMEWGFPQLNDLLTKKEIKKDNGMDFAKFNKVDSILFDLDGTLWDASKTSAKALNEALRQFGYGSNIFDDKTIRPFSGLRIEILFKKYFDFIPEQDQEGFIELYQTNEKDLMKVIGGELFPHVKEVLAALSREYKLFIVSNCATGYIENFIGFHKLQNLFADFEPSGNTGLPKSENIKLITGRNHLKNSIYVGDTLWDYEAARKANIPFIYAAYGFGQVNDADRKINDIIELEQLLIK